MIYPSVSNLTFLISKIKNSGGLNHLFEVGLLQFIKSVWYRMQHKHITKKNSKCFLTE